MTLSTQMTRGALALPLLLLFVLLGLLESPPSPLVSALAAETAMLRQV